MRLLANSHLTFSSSESKAASELRSVTQGLKTRVLVDAICTAASSDALVSPDAVARIILASNAKFSLCSTDKGVNTNSSDSLIFVSSVTRDTPRMDSCCYSEVSPALEVLSANAEMLAKCLHLSSALRSASERRWSQSLGETSESFFYARQIHAGKKKSEKSKGRTFRLFSALFVGWYLNEVRVCYSQREKNNAVFVSLKRMYLVTV